MTKRAIILVLDGVGIGDAHDASLYGDVGNNTLAHVCEQVRDLHLPNLEAAGLGNVIPLERVPPAGNPSAAFGIMEPRSAGKDSTTGHWEIAGLQLDRAFPTYPNGFPGDVISRFARATGRGVIGNIAASGTEIITRLGAEHDRTGRWIVYTSADSVFQIAANEDHVPLEELYAACEIARTQLVAPHDVSRVIARPFTGLEGVYQRTAHRKDYSLAPPGETLLDALASAGVARAGVGKVDDLFAGRGLEARHTENNAAGIEAILHWLRSASGGLLFANLVDFDTLYGHRGDAPGFARALEEFDRALPEIRSALAKDDLLFITADHGNDPTTGSSDHARERVPLLVLGGRVKPVALGTRETFSDLGATVADWLDVGFRGQGTSFLPLVERAA